ncbi:hypothetical protein HanPSC8_Chr15g0675251 [Helianthus annuus]|nr:hypothetical protein HanPSC8_Chr15g0675251 [Helianthus annuus]
MWNQLHTKQLQNLQNSSTRTRVKCGFQVYMSSSSSSSSFLVIHPCCSLSEFTCARLLYC